MLERRKKPIVDLQIVAPFVNLSALMAIEFAFEVVPERRVLVGGRAKRSVRLARKSAPQILPQRCASEDPACEIHKAPLPSFRLDARHPRRAHPMQRGARGCRKPNLSRAGRPNSCSLAEAIANPGFGPDDRRGGGVALDLGAQLADEDPEILRVVLVRKVPTRR